MAEIEVELQNVTKKFGDFVAVENVSLQIETGEFFSLLGPSGCGKTTCLRMIAGFEDPTSGDGSTARSIEVTMQAEVPDRMGAGACRWSLSPSPPQP